MGVKFAGGLLLLYVVWKFYRELRMPAHSEHHIDAKKAGLMAAIWTIIIADFSMSLDNVLAVAGAAHENVAALGIGLVFSIVLMAFASNLIAKYLDKYPQIQWVGLFVILFVAIEMILSGTQELDTKLFHFNVLPFIIFILGGLFVVLHTKYIRAADEKKLAIYIQDHALVILSGAIVLFSLMLFFGDTIVVYIRAHHSIFYSIIFILFFSLLEIISLVKMRRKQSRA